VRENVGSRDLVTIGNLTGGDSIANVSANGGAGGNVTLTIAPLAASGNSGNSTAQSSATNTGNTGGASSTGIADPTAQSGNSGNTGHSGDASSDLGNGLQAAAVSNNAETAAGANSRKKGAITSDVAAGAAIGG